MPPPPLPRRPRGFALHAVRACAQISKRSVQILTPPASRWSSRSRTHTQRHAHPRAPRTGEPPLRDVCVCVYVCACVCWCTRGSGESEGRRWFPLGGLAIITHTQKKTSLLFHTPTHTLTHTQEDTHTRTESRRMRETVRKTSMESKDEEWGRERVIKRTKCKRKTRCWGKSGHREITASGEVLQKSASYHLKWPSV